MFSNILFAAGIFILLAFFLFAAVTIAIIEWFDRKREAATAQTAGHAEKEPSYDGRDVIRFAEAFNKSHGA